MLVVAREVDTANDVERLFRRFKGFRRIFSRFDKLDLVFIASIRKIVDLPAAFVYIRYLSNSRSI
jgi:hypothetical protein